MDSVQPSAELDRVIAVPRRHWTPAQSDALVARLTSVLRAPGGTQTLKRLQALALAELAQWGGLFAPLPVGEGKTLLMLLSPHMVSAERPLFLMPAHLIGKTEHEAREYRKHWNLPHFYRIQSYQTLSRVSSEGFLDSYAPDLIVCDEAHYLKTAKAGCTRRVSRYIRDTRAAGKTVRFAALTGSPMGRSIRDFAHLVSWALPLTNPCPAKWEPLDEWSRALDIEVHPMRRLHPGALASLPEGPGASPFEEPVTRARRAFQSRLASAPGVIVTTAPQLQIPLTIRSTQIELDGIQDEAFQILREDWRTPDEIDVPDGGAQWRHARELSTGFYSVWDPRPPVEWRTARCEWNRECREVLTSNRRGIDTEEQLKRFLDIHPELYPLASAALARWREIEPTFLANPVPTWISDHTIDDIIRRAKKPTLIWTDRPAVGERLAARGIPYYGAEGIDAATGRAVETHSPSEGSIVLARKANDSGRNLQAWHRNLVIDVPSHPTCWEQMLGRTHRFGQRAERIEVEVMVGCIEDVVALWRAFRSAKGDQDITGLPQKLCHADLDDFVTEQEAATWAGPQWKKAK